MAKELSGVFSASASIILEQNELDIKSTIKHAIRNDELGAQPAFLGSTSQGQLIAIEEKIKLITEISKHKFKKEVLIGTGCNSLRDTIKIIKHSLDCNLNKFLIGNPAYYMSGTSNKNDEAGIFDFFSKIAKETKEARIVLYSFDKLMHFKFSASLITKLKSEHSSSFIALKDSSGNNWNKLKLPEFSMFVGDESKLVTGLKQKFVDGVISATANIQPFEIAQVYNDFKNNKLDESLNDKMIKVRQAFEGDGNNLTSAVHTFLAQRDKKYRRILPPLSLLSREKEKELLSKLKELNFIPKTNNIAA